MASEPSNSAKSKVRERHAIGLVDPPGTAANSNQMLLEAIGLHLPGAAFIHPHAPLREALTRETVATVLSIGAGAPRSGAAFTPIGRAWSSMRRPAA